MNGLRGCSVFTLCVAFLLTMTACAGGRAKIRFDKLAYPVSTSPYVKIAKTEILRDEKKTPKAEFVINKKFWGILYSFVRLSDGDELIEELNSKIRAHNGKAVTNLKIESDACAINFVIILSVLPFFPGCTNVTLSGEIID